MAEPTDRVVDLFSPTGCDVAMALLLDPAARLGTMEIARRTDRSPGRASELLAALRNAGLVESKGHLKLTDLEPGRRIELLTYALRVRCSTD